MDQVQVKNIKMYIRTNKKYSLTHLFPMLPPLLLPLKRSENQRIKDFPIFPELQKGNIGKK